MARKSKNNNTPKIEVTSDTRLMGDVVNLEIDPNKQKLIDIISKKPEFKFEKVNTFEVKTTNKLLKEIAAYREEFKVSEETAIKLAQRLLGVGETGKWNSTTASAFDQLSTPVDFINDYRNRRK